MSKAAVMQLWRKPGVARLRIGNDVIGLRLNVTSLSARSVTFFVRNRTWTEWNHWSVRLAARILST